jgi:hypothetical protein
VVLKNSQCSVGATSVASAGLSEMVTVALTFNDTFSGVKSVYMYGAEAAANTGWVQKGTYTVTTSGGPSAVSVSPSSGSGVSQTFTFTFSDTQNASNLTGMAMLFSVNASAINACYIVYDSNRGTVALAWDSALGADSKPLNSTVVLKNSQCSVGATSVASAGLSEMVTVALTFNGTFSGVKSVYMYGAEATANTGWVQKGTYTVTTSGPVGISATQAVLSYTAPDNNSCRVEVSENANYSPLIHDVDPGLFPGSDSDGRSGNVVSGTKRTFVVGKRVSEKAFNGNIYSRALQAWTQHYARITCGASVFSTSFTTSNIPFGATYLDLPPLQSPTLQAGIPVVDEQTGALIKMAAPSANHISAGEASLGSGGQYPVCSSEVVGPDNGYLCAFLTQTGGGPAAAYYYVPSTGEMRYQGSYISTNSDGPDGWNDQVAGYPQPGRVTYISLLTRSGKTAILKGTYNGTYQAAQPATVVPMVWTQVNFDGGDLASALRNFNPAIIAINCDIGGVEGNWFGVLCRSGIQDTYPYALGVIDLTTGRAVAARNMMTESPTRFCGAHNFHFLAGGSGIPIMELTFHGLEAGGQILGGGPYSVTLVGNVTSNQTTITVSGEPQALPGDLPMQALPGDYFKSSREYMRIISKISPTQWVVQRAAIAGNLWPAVNYNSGDTLTADCGVHGLDGRWADTYWKFLEDPLGTNLIVNQNWPGGSHDDAGPNLHLTEGYGFTAGPIDTWLSSGVEHTITPDPTFAGIKVKADGNTTIMHPSYRQTSDPNWFTDERAFEGGNLQSDTHVSVSGHLYKYTFPSWFSDSGIHPKIRPTLSFTQGLRLTDVSRPGSFISDGPDMPDTFCWAFLNGECRPNATAGDLYANIPDLQLLHCAANDNPNIGYHDWCALDSPPLGQTVLQVGITPNRVGVLPIEASSVYGVGWTRAVSRGFGSIRDIGLLAKPTPDGKWLFFSQRIKGAEGPLLMLKLPPFEAEDAIDRSTFIPAMVAVAPNPQAASAVVEFGYSEQGAPGQYYCTGRQESCVAISSSINPTDPFKFKDSEQYSGVPCQAGCQIAIPLVPQHIAYFQVMYLDSSNHVMALGSQGIATETGTQ